MSERRSKPVRMRWDLFSIREVPASSRPPGRRHLLRLFPLSFRQSAFSSMRKPPMWRKRRGRFVCRFCSFMETKRPDSVTKRLLRPTCLLSGFFVSGRIQRPMICYNVKGFIAMPVRFSRGCCWIPLRMPMAERERFSIGLSCQKKSGLGSF